MTLQVQTLRSSGEDVDLLITGACEGAMREVIYDPALATGAAHLTARAMSMVFALESGVKVLLAWEGDKQDHLLLPLEGRGTLDFSKFGGLVNPREEGWTGRILLKAEGIGHFTIALDLSKQRN